MPTTTEKKAPKRGRPREFDREAALCAAMELFWRKGYTATSISELCAAMGINSPSLYAAFGGKEALYEAAIRQYQETLGPFVWGGFSEAPTAREAIEALLLSSAEVLPRRGKPLGCMVTLASAGDEGHAELKALLVELRAHTLQRIRERLERAMAEGELSRDVEPQHIARFYAGVQQAMSIQARDGATREDLRASARLAMKAWKTVTEASR
ncbi:Transcriptional regulator, TetR family [Cystobacter fuscus DSM 2262]|uniref:Transcriptional regulator, TetR family n=1 Tax=Cystobacter fuscus (strain ATCC 25194 / DSM 2262 / NBRC 100088 / M29) TaxID=1242864 RepID=S9P0E2_CYSF2|nr:TetR/AcrR family transcriptional regulator [Cystobacter fuscus]EPX55727.1 Transcriptional regulator, TetR family [Cystobacter fuscus DSM 2262]